MRVERLMIVGLVTASVACSEDATGNVAGDAATYDRTVSDAPRIDATVWDGGVDATRDVPYDGWLPDAYVQRGSSRPMADVVDDFPGCEPGSLVDCACFDGGVGYQLCSDRNVWLRCDCGGWVAPATGLPPRLISPISNLRVNSQRPTLRWELPSGLTRARVELCEDRACTRQIAHAEVAESSWRSPTPLRPGVIFWRVLGLRDDASTAWTSATWEFGVRHRDTPLDTAWGSFKDFDGDGYDDLLVQVGRVGSGSSGPVSQGYQVFRGRPDGLELVPASRITGRATDLFIPCEGNRPLSTSDLNSDGLADVVFACDSGMEVYYGMSDGTVLRHGGHFLAGGSVLLVDLDGDGDDDFFSTADHEYQAIVYTNVAGSFDEDRFTTFGTTEIHGIAPVSMGDVDGDGYGDGVLLYPNVELFLGSPSIDFRRRSFTRQGFHLAPGFISAFFGVDLDADGDPDMVSDVLLEYHAFDRQMVMVRGAREYPPDCLQNFWNLARPGDLDGDGWPELPTSQFCAYNTPESPGGSTVQIRRTGPTGVLPMPSSTETSEWAAVVGIPGDLDGDGYDDLVIAFDASPRNFAAADRLQVRYGGGGPPSTRRVYEIPAPMLIVANVTYPLF